MFTLVYLYNKVCTFNTFTKWKEIFLQFTSDGQMKTHDWYFTLKRNCGRPHRSCQFTKQRNYYFMTIKLITRHRETSKYPYTERDGGPPCMSGLPDEIKECVERRNDRLLAAGRHLVLDVRVAGSDRENAYNADDGGDDGRREVVDQSSCTHPSAGLGIELCQTCWTTNLFKVDWLYTVQCTIILTLYTFLIHNFNFYGALS